MPNKEPATTENHPHPQDSHPHEHECPEHYHRCHATFHGYIDCPKPHIHKPERTTRLLTVPCGAQNPDGQIQAFVAANIGTHPLVTNVLDLGHDGWLVVFSVDAP